MVATKVLNQYAVSDVSLVVLETASDAYPFTTSSEIETEEVVEEGEEQSLIIKNKVIANRAAQDAVLGTDVTMVDNVFCPEVICLMQGGKIEGTKYTAPKIGELPAKTKFTTTVYSAVVSTDGDTGQFVKIVYPGCSGNSVPLSFKDGEYSAPEYTINSRPAQGQAAYETDIVSSLPEFSLKTVLVAGNSEVRGTAGDKTITALTTGKKYRVIDLCTNKTYYSLATGKLTTNKGSVAQLTGTALTDLENGHTYLVDIIE